MSWEKVKDIQTAGGVALLNSEQAMKECINEFIEGYAYIVGERNKFFNTGNMKIVDSTEEYIKTMFEVFIKIRINNIIKQFKKAKESKIWCDDETI